MGWVKAASINDVPEGQMIQVTIGDDDIAVYHTAEGYFATSDVCTHASESLSSGTLAGHVVACPKHGGKFDVRTGQPVAFPCVYSLQKYELEIRGDEVWIEYE